MALKILATADLHLGKRSSDIGANFPEAATRFTWERIINCAIEQQVDLLLLSGDIIDKDNRYFEAIGPLQKGFSRLREAGISVYMVAGNHDYGTLPQTLGNFENVHMLGLNATWEVKTFSRKGEQLQLVGWSFPSQHFTADPFQDFDPSLLDPAIPSIGLVHGDVNAVETSYAPMELSSFQRSGVPVWIVGHIHKPGVIWESGPAVHYPGSPHAMSAKEQGIHGPLLLTLQSRDELSIERIPLSPTRYEHLILDLSNTSTEEELRELVIRELVEWARTAEHELQQVNFLIFDLSLEGTHPHLREVDSWLALLRNDLEYELDNGTKLSVRKINNYLRPRVTLEEISQQKSPAGMLAQAILALQTGQSNEFVEELLEKWKTSEEELNRAKTFFPLRKIGKEVTSDALARESVLKECNRLLGELIAQTS